MSRRLIACLVFASATAHADVPVAGGDKVDEVADDTDEIGAQHLGGQIGIAGGGRVTPGGLRITGHYLYQLSAQDWFDGTASFTFGGGGAECFRDRMGFLVCDHGFADGSGIEAVAAVRRYFAAQGQFRPYARVGVGVGVVRYGDDDVTGLVIPVHLGGGIRAQVAKTVAVVGQADLIVGFGRFGRGLGNEPQLGIAVTAGAELQLP